MSDEQQQGRKPEPGVSRVERLSIEGLQRLEKQLRSGSNISPMVLAQWIRRYGEDARQVIAQYGKLNEEVKKLL